MLGKRPIEATSSTEPKLEDATGPDHAEPDPNPRKRSKLLINARAKSNIDGGCLTPGVSPRQPPFSEVVKQKNSEKDTYIGHYVLLSPLDSNGFSAHALDTTKNCLKSCQTLTVAQYRQLLVVSERLDSKCPKSQDAILLKQRILPSNFEIIRKGEVQYLFANRTYGSLHSYVQQRGKLAESQAAPLYQQIVEMLALCHSVGIVVRDLKLRKFVFVDEIKCTLRLSSVTDLVVCDRLDDDRLQSRLGSPAYVSPEILDINCGYSGKAADIWSIGVLLFVMLLGRYPFYHNTPSGLFAKIKHAAFSIPNESGLSIEVRFLLRGLLRRDAKERPSAEQLLAFPWLVNGPLPPTPQNFLKPQINCDDHVVPSI